LRDKIVDSAKRGAANIRHIGKPSNKASGDFGRNPLWAGAILAFAGKLMSILGCLAKTVTAQRVFHRVGGS